MIKLENNILNYKGNKDDIIVESLLIIDYLFKELDTVQQYIYMKMLLSTIVESMEDKNE